MKIALVYQFKNDFEDLKNFQIRAKQEFADLIEIRLDYADPKDIFVQTLDRIKSTVQLPIILTIRSVAEGGVNDFPLKQRIELWKYAFEKDFEYIDIELETALRHEIDLINLKRNSISKVIVSYHNFVADETYEDLLSFRNEMYEIGADIAKLVVSYENENTNQTILKLIEETKKLNREIIAIAMGEKGKITRLEGLKRGAYLTFASLEGITTAPGQCTVSEVRKYLQSIQGSIK